MLDPLSRYPKQQPSLTALATDGGRMPQERLFMGPRVDEIRSQAIDGVSPVVARFKEGRLRGNSLDELARYVVDDIMGQPLELDTGNHSYEHQVVPLAELDVRTPNGAQSAVDVVRLSLHIPYTGTRTVLNPAKPYARYT